MSTIAVLGALDTNSFIESGIWRTRCMGQIEFVIKKLAALSYEEGWEQMLQDIRLLSAVVFIRKPL